MKRIISLFCLSVIFAGCKKQPAEITVDEIAPRIAMVIDEEGLGYKIAPEFLGLSYETQLLVKKPDFLHSDNKILAQLIKNLGPGIIRIGGNTSDEIDWLDEVRTPLTPANTLTRSDVDRLGGFSRLCGWKVLFGLNLGNYDISKAVSEARYTTATLGEQLYNLETGNEPDAYQYYSVRYPEYDFNIYHNEWTDYFTKIRTTIPGVRFSGPGISFNTDWLTSFAQAESKNLSLLDAHYYCTGPASDAGITYYDLLKKTPFLPAYLRRLNALSTTYHIPYRITETNSVFGGGKYGVSNVFAASLWALDMMWQVASNNGQGVNFHGGQGLFYSPVDLETGEMNAKPVYYAMLAFKFGNHDGSTVPVSVSDPDNLNLTAYGCLNADGSTSITIINKEDRKEADISLTSKHFVSSAKAMRLLAPSLGSFDGIKLGNAQVSNNGTFTPGELETLTVKNKPIALHVAPASAVIITIR